MYFHLLPQLVPVLVCLKLVRLSVNEIISLQEIQLSDLAAFYQHHLKLLYLGASAGNHKLICTSEPTSTHIHFGMRLASFSIITSLTPFSLPIYLKGQLFRQLSLFPSTSFVCLLPILLLPFLFLNFMKIPIRT